jgi:Chromo (CHRromatin Organisation MOdifier) domain
LHIFYQVNINSFSLKRHCADEQNRIVQESIINSRVNVEAKELASRLEADMMNELEETEKLTEVQGTKRKERETVDDKEWNKQLSAEQRKKQRKNKGKAKQRFTDDEETDEEEQTADQEESEVEAILEKRWKGKRLEYFVKWTGYPDSANCWIQFVDCNCLELIQAFEYEAQKKK